MGPKLQGTQAVLAAPEEGTGHLREMTAPGDGLKAPELPALLKEHLHTSPSHEQPSTCERPVGLTVAKGWGARGQPLFSGHRVSMLDSRVMLGRRRKLSDAKSELPASPAG